MKNDFITKINLNKMAINYLLTLVVTFTIKLSRATDTIPGSCLSQSDKWSGVQEGSVFSNKYEIIDHSSSL